MARVSFFLHLAGSFCPTWSNAAGLVSYNPNSDYTGFLLSRCNWLYLNVCLLLQNNSTQNVLVFKGLLLIKIDHLQFNLKDGEFFILLENDLLPIVFWIKYWFGPTWLIDESRLFGLIPMEQEMTLFFEGSSCFSGSYAPGPGIFSFA